MLSSCRMLKTASIRSFTTTVPRPFLGNFFGNKEVKQQEIIKKQEDFEIDPEAKITILNKENSPDYVPFDPETEMPDFKVNQWKDHVLLGKEIESTFSNNSKLTDILNESYQQLTQNTISENQYQSIDLHDLEFRFKYAKLLQQKLGFDINDYLLSKSHTLSDLHTGLQSVVLRRWVNERNPNAIVIRSEDFSAPNIYLNEELTEKQQEKKLQKLIEEARAASE